MITTAVNVCNPVSVVFKSDYREHCGSFLYAAGLKEIWFITLSLPQHGDFPLQILLRYPCTRMGYREVTVTFIFDGQNRISPSLSQSGQLFQICLNSIKAFLRYHACNKGTDGWTEGQPENKSSVHGYLWHGDKIHWLQDEGAWSAKMWTFQVFGLIPAALCTFSLMLTLQSARITVKITTALLYKLFLVMPDDM